MRLIISTIFLGIFLVSCGSNDPQARLRELAGDDWEELKASPEMLNTFAYLCQANMEAA